MSNLATLTLYVVYSFLVSHCTLLFNKRNTLLYIVIIIIRVLLQTISKGTFYSIQILLYMHILDYK